MLIKLYNIYNKAKNVFIKPKLKFTIYTCRYKLFDRLPYWLQFGIINKELYCKLKYGVYRYDSPPIFAIMIFGIIFEWILEEPYKKNNVYIGAYWESILTYLDTKDIIKTDEIMGRSFTVGIKNSGKYNLNTNFLKEPYKSQLIEWRTKHI